MNGFWDWERFVLQIVFLALFFRIMWDLKHLVQQGRDDKKAREIAVVELRQTALVLANKTAEILAESEARGTAAINAVARSNTTAGAMLQDIEKNTREGAEAGRETADALKNGAEHK